MRIGIFGRGRLGSAVAQAITEANLTHTHPIEIVWQVGRGDTPPMTPVDLAFDASVGSALPDHLAWALFHQVSLVVGATGYHPRLFDTVRGNRNLPIGVLVASNFSIGVAFMRKVALALGRLAELSPSYDLALSERHHRAKLDSPSGTAKTLASALLEGAPRYKGYALSPAGTDEIPIASLRTGLDMGYHEIRCNSGLESLTISHEAYDRKLFAQGALTAIRWLEGKSGFFLFEDLAREMIDPLFK